MSFLTKGIKKVVDNLESSTVHFGFSNEEHWVSSGNLALNRMLSGSYFRAMEYGRTNLVGGISGSGKSLLLATAAKQAQEDGAHIIWIDTENATRQRWLERVGLKVDEDRGDPFTYVQVAVIDDVKKIVSSIVEMYDKEVEKNKDGVKPKIFIVIDSYSMMLTSKQMEEAKAGKTVGDQGQHAKQTKDLIKACNALIVRRNILVAGVVHTMESQDKYQPDEIILGGRGAQYIADTVLVFSKYKLKGKDAETKTEGDATDVVGLKCKATIRKSRYTRPETSVDMQIVFGQGLDRYSGLFDLLRDEGIIKMPKSGWYTLTHSVPGLKPPGDMWRKSEFIGNMAETLVRFLEDNADSLVLAPVKVQDEKDIIAPEESEEGTEE